MPLRLTFNTLKHLFACCLLLTGFALPLSAWAVDTDGDGVDDSIDAFPTKPEATTPAKPQTVHLQLQRIAVQQDGAVGNADWRFAIEADGQPLFAFQQDAMTSEGGRNIVVAANDRDANAELDLAPGEPVAITIKGWRGGWFKKADEPLVVGEGWLTSTGALAPIKVKAQDEKDGAFTFYLSASAEQ